MRLRRRKKLTWKDFAAHAQVSFAALDTSLPRLGAAGVTAAEAMRAFETSWRRMNEALACRAPSPFAFFDAPLTCRAPSPFAFFDAPLTKSMAEIASGVSA